MSAVLAAIDNSLACSSVLATARALGRRVRGRRRGDPRSRGRRSSAGCRRRGARQAANRRRAGDRAPDRGRRVGRGRRARDRIAPAARRPPAARRDSARRCEQALETRRRRAAPCATPRCDSARARPPRGNETDVPRTAFDHRDRTRRRTSRSWRCTSSTRRRSLHSPTSHSTSRPRGHASSSHATAPGASAPSASRRGSERARHHPRVRRGVRYGHDRARLGTGPRSGKSTRRPRNPRTGMHPRDADTCGVHSVARAVGVNRALGVESGTCRRVPETRRSGITCGRWSITGLPAPSVPKRDSPASGPDLA